MSIVFLAKGTATMGLTKTDNAGNVVSQMSAEFTVNDTGCSVAVGVLDTETFKPKEPISSLYADWDAAGYLSEALLLLKPNRPDNIPDFKGIIQTAMKDGVDFCEYCRGCSHCPDCIIREWEAELRE